MINAMETRNSVIWRTVATELPFIKFPIAAALVLSVGCKRGPITIAGLIVTMSMPFTNFQAVSSAKVSKSTSHAYKGAKIREI